MGQNSSKSSIPLKGIKTEINNREIFVNNFYIVTPTPFPKNFTKNDNDLLTLDNDLTQGYFCPYIYDTFTFSELQKTKTTIQNVPEAKYLITNSFAGCGFIIVKYADGSITTYHDSKPKSYSVEKMSQIFHTDPLSIFVVVHQDDKKEIVDAYQTSLAMPYKYQGIYKSLRIISYREIGCIMYLQFIEGEWCLIKKEASSQYFEKLAFYDLVVWSSM